MSDQREECLVEAGRVQPCEGLNAVAELGGQGTRHQGVKVVSLMNLKTRKFSRTMYVLKSGDHGKRGVFMNFCPFCGKDIAVEPVEDEPEVGS